MRGEQDLALLLRTMQPVLQPEEYVFCTLPVAQAIPLHLAPVCVFGEAEGTTLILSRSLAEKAGLAYVYPCRMVTLNVHSSLEAVGFLARITARLAEQGISVNPVSAYYHDHLFVPADRIEEVMRLLEALRSQQ